MAVAAAAGATAAVAAGSGAAPDWSWASGAADSSHSMHSSSSNRGAAANGDLSALTSTDNLLVSHCTLGSSLPLNVSGAEPLGPGTSPTAASTAAASLFTLPAGAGAGGLTQQGSVNTRSKDSSSLQLLGLDHEPRSAADGDAKIAMIAPGGSPTAAAAALQQQQGFAESVFDQEHSAGQQQQQEVQWVRPKEQQELLGHGSKGVEGPQVMNVLATTPRAGELILSE